MRKFANISTALLLGCFLASVSTETFAQTVKLRVVAMTPGKLAAIGKSSLMATTGLKVIGKGEKAYLLADTTGFGATIATSFTWSFVSRPTASNAVFDTANNSNPYQSFTADSTGQYVVSVSVNGGAVVQDTFWVSTYIGSVGGSFSCASCHSYPVSGPDGTFPAAVAPWQTTAHSFIYKQGIMGELEVNAYGQGEYSTSCWKCHTTGYDVTANNGNFGYLSHSLGWDTTAFKGKAKSGSSYLINNGDSCDL